MELFHTLSLISKGQSGRALGQILGKYRVSGGPPQFCHPPYLWHGLTDQAHILGNQNTRSQVLFGVLSPRIHMQIPPKVLEKLGSAQGKKIRCPLLIRLGVLTDDLASHFLNRVRPPFTIVGPAEGPAGLLLDGVSVGAAGVRLPGAVDLHAKPARGCGQG